MCEQLLDDTLTVAVDSQLMGSFSDAVEGARHNWKLITKLPSPPINDCVRICKTAVARAASAAGWSGDALDQNCKMVGCTSYLLGVI